MAGAIAEPEVFGNPEQPFIRLIESKGPYAVTGEQKWVRIPRTDDIIKKTRELAK